MLREISKIFILFGILFLVIGLLLYFGKSLGKIPYLGKLPGDIFIKKGNFTFYFPLSTCILISILLTLIISLFFRR